MGIELRRKPMPDQMQIDAIREHLLEAVQLCAQVIKKTDPIPAYQCVRLEVKDGALLQIAGLSRETTIVTSISARVVHAGEPVAVYADRLLAHLEAIPENETVRLSTQTSFLRLAAAKHNTRMNLLDWQLLPVQEVVDEVLLGALTDGGEGVFRGCYASDSSGALAAMRLDVKDGNLVASATNSYRAATMTAGLGQNHNEVIFGLPRDAASLVAKSFKDKTIQVSANNRQIVFVSGDVKMICITTATPPPDIARRLPPAYATKLTIPVRPFRKEVKACKAACDHNLVGQMRIIPADSQVFLTAANPGYGDTAIEVDGLNGEGEEVTVSINLGYLDDALGQVTGDAAILQVSADRALISVRPQFDGRENHVICAMRS
jgi:DNA polymerase-3 subunit beta